MLHWRVRRFERARAPGNEYLERPNSHFKRQINGIRLTDAMPGGLFLKQNGPPARFNHLGFCTPAIERVSERKKHDESKVNAGSAGALDRSFAGRLAALRSESTGTRPRRANADAGPDARASYVPTPVGNAGDAAFAHPRSEVRARLFERTILVSEPHRALHTDAHTGT
jgi:hypothetical protein